jgi:murein DD-endopeptidase MepM/ murein hydrolase activator NlpD
MLRPPCIALAVALACSAPAVAAAAGARGDADVAALQVALAKRSLYASDVDGLPGPATSAALDAFQARAGLTPDGVLGPASARRLGRRELGTRLLADGAAGWDVAELQFLLAWAGFPSGAFDGRFGPHVESALRRFQADHGLLVDGVAGPATLALLHDPPPTVPIALEDPVDAAVGDGFGPRGDRFHAGVDFLAPAGAVVRAAAPGRVTWTGWRSGWGLLVTLANGDGVRTLYAHLSQIDVTLGQRVGPAAPLGLVGTTGDATGPHLHFEVRVRGAAVDPLQALRGAA